MRAVAFGLLALLLLPGEPAWPDYQDGLNAYSTGNYQQAMREWLEVVEGPADAVVPTIYSETHYAIAMLYWQGEGVTRDYYESRRWLLRAAELGHAGAMAKLGFMYTDGLTVDQDYAEAITWFRQAAEKGNADGLYNLGVFYLYGWGTEPDRTMAKQYLASASALGDLAAERALQTLLAEDDAAAQALIVPDEAIVQGDETDLSISFDSGDGLFQPEAEDTAVSQPSVEAPEPSDFVDQPPVPVVADEAWILEQDPDHYTIQVMALKSETVLREQIDGFERLAPYAIYRLSNDGDPLFVLVQGHYETVEDARAARDAFPRAVQRPENVWIRRFAKVQERIRGELP
jgi:tetratricopeptide (TPR) repeat protein